VGRPDVTLHLGDCLELLPTIPDASVDCVVTDPPYPCIKRPYGVWTEAEWFAMMDVVVPECRRILKPTGSAVFILQPNSERVGRMRPWLWEFMAKWTREWGMVQDVWWWNDGAPPTVHCNRKYGLMRPSLKACVWLANDDCYRNQDNVLQPIAASTLKDKRRDQTRLDYTPQGGSYRRGRCLTTCIERGGSTPLNVLPVCNSAASGSAAEHGHGAGTPETLADWWLRYICPPGGTVLDPFIGSGTVGLAALKQSKSAIGIERIPEYHAIASRRIAAELDKLALLEPAV
jgi:DNA modification methylase